MATIAPTEIDIDGIDDAPVAAEIGGDDFANTGNEFAMIHNGGGAPITVTPTIPATLSSGEQITPGVVTVNAGVRKLMGPYNRQVYGPSVALAYSAVTTVTISIYRLTPTQHSTVAGV